MPSRLGGAVGSRAAFWREMVSALSLRPQRLRSGLTYWWAEPTATEPSPTAPATYRPRGFADPPSSDLWVAGREVTHPSLRQVLPACAALLGAAGCKPVVSDG